MSKILYVLIIMIVIITAGCSDAETNTVTLAENGISEYTLIRPDTASQEIIGAATMIRSSVKERLGIVMAIATDFENIKAGIVRTDYEILIGKTNRNDSPTGLRKYDYDIYQDGTRIVLVGGSDQAVVNAAEYLVDNFIDIKAGTFKAPQSYGYRAEYPIASLTIDGTDISEFVLVCDDNSAAQYFQGILGELTGITPAIVNPDMTDNHPHCIVIGGCTEAGIALSAATEAGECSYRLRDGKLYITADSNHFFDEITVINTFVSSELGADPETLKAKSKTVNIDKPEGSIKMETDIIFATDEILAQIDEKAEKLRNSILNGSYETKTAGKSYYISEDGDDSNDGLSPENAWKTIDRIGNAKLNSGDAVLFERGGTFRGKFTTVSGVTYSAYGNGAKPVVVGSPFDGAKTGKWEVTEYKNIYRYSERIPDDVGIITYNDGEGYIGKLTVNFTGDETEDSLDNILKTRLTSDLKFYHDCGGANLTASADTGYIYMYSEKGDPAGRFENLEFNTRGNIISNKSSNNVTVENLCIAYGGSHGVGSGTCDGLTVRFCEFKWIGGSVQIYRDGKYTRFGNAVEIYGGCDNYSVTDCYIHDIYDAGVTHQRKGKSESPVIMENITYSRNLFEHCIYTVEYFNDISGTGAEKSVMRNVLVSDNIMRNAGGFGFDERPNKVARLIQGGWLNSKRGYPAENFVIENNIFDRSVDVLVSISSNKESDLPVMRGNTYIQYAGKDYGMYGVDYSFYYKFDATVADTIRNIQSEKDAVIIVIPEN